MKYLVPMLVGGIIAAALFGYGCVGFRSEAEIAASKATATAITRLSETEGKALTPTAAMQAQITPTSTPVPPTAAAVQVAPTISTTVLPPAAPVTTTAVIATAPVTPTIDLTGCTGGASVYPPYGEFLTVWTQLRNELGCPGGETKLNVGFAIQRFESGSIIWLDLDADGDNINGTADLIFILINGGQWIGQNDTWTSGDFFCEEAKAFGDKSPKGGIGKVWCASAKDLVGNPIDLATGGPAYQQGIIQCLEKGCLVYVPTDNQVWALHSAGSAWSIFEKTK
jgi:hypothetical protein